MARRSRAHPKSFGPDVAERSGRDLPRTVRRAANRRAAILAREAYAAYRDAMLADIHEGLEESQIDAWRPGHALNEGGSQ